MTFLSKSFEQKIWHSYEKSFEKYDIPMNILWKKYDIPMNILWKKYDIHWHS